MYGEHQEPESQVKDRMTAAPRIMFNQCTIFCMNGNRPFTSTSQVHSAVRSLGLCRLKHGTSRDHEMLRNSRNEASWANSIGDGHEW